MDDTLKFARRLTKLYQPIFPTIRLDSDLTEKQVVNVLVDGEKVGWAKVIKKMEVQVEDLSTEFLGRDTDTIDMTNVRESALNALREYYPDLDEKTSVVVLFLEWVKPYQSLQTLKEGEN